MSNQLTAVPTPPPTLTSTGAPVTNDLIENLRSVMTQSFLSQDRRTELDVLLRIFSDILTEIENRIGQTVPVATRFQMLSGIGVIFFSDRLLIHSSLLCEFLGWTELQLDRVLNCDEFRGSALSCRQFTMLQNGFGLRGSKFDWHVHHHPRIIESQDLLKHVYGGSGE
jgi:hypothetical protein